MVFYVPVAIGIDGGFQNRHLKVDVNRATVEIVNHKQFPIHVTDNISFAFNCIVFPPTACVYSEDLQSMELPDLRDTMIDHAGTLYDMEALKIITIDDTVKELLKNQLWTNDSPMINFIAQFLLKAKDYTVTPA